MKEKSEQNLILQAKQGKPEAIAELYRRYWGAARATAYGITSDLSLAEDAASETFLAAMKGLKELKDTHKFGSWLHTIATRTTKRLKTQKRERNILDSSTLDNPGDEDVCTRLEKNEIATLVHEAVGTLSQTLREAISLFYFEGYSVEDAADFLDIPAGTFKRRLYDGRHCLHHAANQIINGQKPVDLNREQILKKLNQLVDNGPQAPDFHKIMRQVLRLRPLPYELMRTFIQRHSKTAKKTATIEGRKEVESRAQRVMTFISQPSVRARNPNHPVGKTAGAIRAALPEFKQWHIDLSKAAHNFVQKFAGINTDSYMPPGFSQGIPDSYIYAARGQLMYAPNGSACSPYKYFLNIDATSKAEGFKQVISDTLILQWMRTDTIELRTVEELLSRLCRKVVPDIPFRFLPHEEPRYRSALSLHFENISIPAAIGGPLDAFQTIPDNTFIAIVQIFLEPWAFVKCGWEIKLDELSTLLSKLKL